MDARWRTLGLVLVGLGLAAVLAVAAWLAWQRLGGSQAESTTYMPLAADKSYGINTDLSQLEETERHAALAQMEAAGLAWLRQRFPWNAIETVPGIYDWASWDQIVDEMGRHNITIVAVLDGSPAWARGEGDEGNSLAPPRESRFFGDFVEAFAARYADRIDYYQIWDEPNIAPHWGAREIDPAGYARLLREGAIRVRSTDPGAVVLLAALAPNIEPGGANLNELHFLDALYQQGAAQWFDVVAAQPYSFAEPVDAPPDPDRLNWRRTELLRDVMETYGDSESAMWAVAFGQPDAAADGVAGSIQVAREQWPWLGPMLWAAWSPQDTHGEYALVSAEGQPGPIYDALQNLATLPAVSWPGVYSADHPSGRFDGDWRVTPLGADIGDSGDQLRISFRGTRLDLQVRRGNYRAFLYVTVDGEPGNALPLDGDGRAYVVLYDPLMQEDTVTVAQDLDDVEHVAEITADRGWGQWAIVGWAVFREGPIGSLWLPIGLAFSASVILAATCAWSWTRRASLVDAVSRLVSDYRSLDDRLALAITAGITFLVYVVVGTVPTLVVLAVLTVLLILRPEMGLPLIALALPFYQLGRPLLGKVFSMVEILTVLTAVGWAVNWSFSQWGSLLWKTGTLVVGVAVRGAEPPEERKAQSTARSLTALDWGVLALVAVGALSLLWAEHGREAAREFRTVILEAAVFYGLLRAMVRDRPAVWRVVDAWVLGGVLISLVGLFQWVFGQNLITAEGVWRVRGFYGSPNNLALYLGKVFPVAVAVAAWGRSGQRRWGYGLAGLFMATTLLLTYSRGALVVGMPAALLFLAVVRGWRAVLHGRRATVVIAGVLVVLAVGLLLVIFGGRLASLLDTTAGTTFFRLQLWRSSVAIIRDHPVLGVGLDNFLYAYRTSYVLPTAWEEFNLSHPHNVFLDFWLRLGLPGLLVFLGLLVAFFRRGCRVYKLLPEGSQRALVLGTMAGMVNLVAHGLVDNAFFLVDLAFAFMLMLALVQVNVTEGRARER